jgi:ABC-type bacteriocin/lantibiotic exporter with double-glycine peptidase domain
LYNSGQAIITLTIEMTLLVGVLGLMIWIEPLGAASLIVFFGFSAFIFQLFTSSKIKNWGNIRVMNVTQMNKTLLESFGAIKELKLLKAEEFFVRRIKKNLNNSSNVTIKQTTLQQIPRYYLEFVTIAGICSLILVMIIQSKPVDSILPTLGLFFAGAFRIIPSLNRIMGSLQAVQFLRPSIDLLYDEFYYINNYNNGNISKSFEVDLGFKNKFSMQNINFSYGSSNVCAIKDLSLDIYRGETIGLIGKSGSGKSTLIDLILGLYRPSSGEIKIDDQIVTERNIRKWQKKIGYVPQSIYLTDDTIRNNIAFGLPLEEINDNLLSDAIKDAQLTEFISNIELGLDTIIGEKGVRISGGQRQRIGIARALYKKPEILILDEATSALDNSTEEDFMKAVDLLKGERTIIIVAHRLSTLKNCDKIYSLSNGVLKIESKNSLIINR